MVGMARLGLYIEAVEKKSFCSGGAMAIHIAGGGADCTLVAIRQWRLILLMLYIHQHSSYFSAFVSVQMTRNPWFRHL